METERISLFARQFSELRALRQRRKRRMAEEARDNTAEEALIASLGALVDHRERHILVGDAWHPTLWYLVRLGSHVSIEELRVERLATLDDPEPTPEPEPDAADDETSITVGYSGLWPTEAQAEGLEAIGLGDAVDQLTEAEAAGILLGWSLGNGFAASACCDVGDLDGPRLATFGPEDVEEVA